MKITVKLILVFLSYSFHENEKQKMNFSIFYLFMRMKNEWGIKNSTQNSFKHENGSQIFEFYFSY